MRCAEDPALDVAAEPVSSGETFGAFCLIVITDGSFKPDVCCLMQRVRIITGRSHVSMIGLTGNAARIAVIVAAATSMSIFAVPLQTLFAAQGDGSLGSAIGGLVAGGYSPVTQIDRNIAATQLTLAAIDAVQVPPNDQEDVEAKIHASLLAGFGAASPPMAAGAMLLLYQFTMAIFIGLGPLFILCLIFDQTKDLFRRWLLYGIGTLFSIATLCLVSSIMLKLVENVAIALWSADLINNFLGSGAEGFSSRALKQGGIGLLLTVVIVSVPPLTSNFFQGTMGNFLFQSAFGAGGARAAAMQQGLPPGAYGGGGGAPPGAIERQDSSGSMGGAGNSYGLGAGVDPRLTGTSAVGGTNSNVGQPPAPGTFGQAGKIS